jgi:hypothetical protein
MKHNTDNGFPAVIPERCKVLACATVIEEMMPLMPAAMQYEVLDFGLHVDPKSLKKALQEAITRAEATADTVILGYGLCSQAVVGLQSARCQLVVPKVDDCIAIFLGSTASYQEQLHKVPGTYYLTKGWIKAGDTPFDEYDRLEKIYGAVRARDILNQVLKNYTRLALINTGQYQLDSYREQSQRIAKKFNLKFEEIPGSNVLIKKMLYGPWDQKFIVAPPQTAISFFDFKKEIKDGE